MYSPQDSIKRAIEYLHSCNYKDYSFEKVAQIANFSPYHFIRVFKAEVGLTPYEYFIMVKIEAIKEKLADKNLSVSEAFSACGVEYSGHFAAVFRKATGMSPSQFRKSLWSK